MDSDFRILGELEVLRDGDLVELGSPRQRAVLARLLINLGEVVSTDRIVEDLWRGGAPDSARHTLHVYVSRLRKALDHDRLVRRGAGYQIVINPDELDASRFEHLAAEGRAALARHDAHKASSQLTEALSIWRGNALSEFADEAFARDEAMRLGELRLGTLEQRIWADLELGCHGEVVEELQDLVTKHPFRETFWEQLMLGLYRCGRQSEALRAYQTARSYLAEELGIEPGPALHMLEERILAQDPSLQQVPGAVPDQIPRMLPLQRTSFVGRERELALGATLLKESRLLTLTGPPRYWEDSPRPEAGSQSYETLDPRVILRSTCGGHQSPNDGQNGCPRARSARGTWGNRLGWNQGLPARSSSAAHSRQLRADSAGRTAGRRDPRCCTRSHHHGHQPSSAPDLRRTRVSNTTTPRSARR